MNTEDLLARSLKELQQGKVSLDEALAHHPEQQEELAPLLHLALRLEALQENPDAFPSPSARARMRDRIMAEIAAEDEEDVVQFPVHRNGYHAAPVPFPPVSPPSQFRWASLGRRFAAMAASLALFMGAAGVGTVSAARDSLPGDLLYPVKAAAEQAQIAFASSDAERASIYLNLAERRLWELSRVSEIGKTDVATQLVAAYDRHLEGAAQSASRAAVDAKSPLPASQLESQLARQEQALRDLSKRAPEPVQEAVAVALSAVNETATQLSQTVKTPQQSSSSMAPAPAASPSASAAAVVETPSASPEPSETVADASLTPLGGPTGGGSSSGLLSGPTAATGGWGLSTEKDTTAPTPTPATEAKNPLPVATLPPAPVHTGDGGAPAAPVAAADAPKSEPGVAEPQTPPDPAVSPAPQVTQPPASEEQSVPEPSSTATPDKPSAISTPVPTGTLGKDGATTQPAPGLRQRIATPNLNNKPAP